MKESVLKEQNRENLELSFQVHFEKDSETFCTNRFLFFRRATEI